MSKYLIAFYNMLFIGICSQGYDDFANWTSLTKAYVCMCVNISVLCFSFLHQSIAIIVKTRFHTNIHTRLTTSRSIFHCLNYTYRARQTLYIYAQIKWNVWNKSLVLSSSTWHPYTHLHIDIDVEEQEQA